jgi:hypothetical protein
LVLASPTASHVFVVGHEMPSSVTGDPPTDCSDPGTPPETRRKTPRCEAASEAGPFVPTSTIRGRCAIAAVR